MASHATSQISPEAPTAKKAARHPKSRTIHATRGGANMAPIAEPLLNIPDASARSRSGNHSATTLTPAGQFPASPIPKRDRNRPSDHGPRESAWSSAAADHHAAQSAKPKRVPKRSSKGPE